MSVIHPHRQFPEDVLPLEAAIWWRDNADLFLRCLTSPKYHHPLIGKDITGNLLIYPPECNRNGDNMNGRKPRGHGGGLGNSDDKPVKFKWVNIPLTSEDIDLLEQETADLQQLALAFIQLGVRGFGLSVKYDSGRKSYACSIYGPDSLNNMQPCGISGTATDLRDALLVSVFRFNNCLQGSFDGCAAPDAVVQPSRFR